MPTRVPNFPGVIKRTLLSTWKVESEEACDVSFPFSGGFGCGASMKVSRGEKLALQTQFKFGSQTGAKVSIPGLEGSQSVSQEISESLQYELTVDYEWAYTSRECEHCAPRVHFPDARITRLAWHRLHLPIFVSRRTRFDPGESYVIRSHCHHSPELCGNCGDAKGPPGRGAVSAGATSGNFVHIERVILFERTPVGENLGQVLDELISDPMDGGRPEQIYLTDLRGELQPAIRPYGRYLLYSVDDADRAVGAVRLYPGLNRLLFFKGVSESYPLAEPPPEFALLDEESGEPKSVGEVAGDMTRDGFRLIEVDLSGATGFAGPLGATLQLTVGNVRTTWPVALIEPVTAPTRTRPATAGAARRESAPEPSVRKARSS